MVENLAFDAGLARLRSWVGHTVEAWVELADGPSHLAGMNGVLASGNDGFAPGADLEESQTFTVGESGWFRVVRGYADDDAQIECSVAFAASPPRLVFEWGDGLLHVVRSSTGDPG
jgi:hypothetical protein